MEATAKGYNCPALIKRVEYHYINCQSTYFSRNPCSSYSQLTIRAFKIVFSSGNSWSIYIGQVTCRKRAIKLLAVNDILR